MLSRLVMGPRVSRLVSNRKQEMSREVSGMVGASRLIWSEELVG